VSPPDLIRLFVQPLERLGVPYMITGGVAAVVYGDPRFTRDIDLVLDLDAGDVDRLLADFSGRDCYAPPAESLREELARPEGGHFNLIDRESGLRADVYLAGDDALHRWALERRTRMRVESGDIRLAPIEYVILRKLQYYRAAGSERHLRDVAMMLRISGDTIDAEAFRPWIRQLELGDLLEEARSCSP